MTPVISAWSAQRCGGDLCYWVHLYSYWLGCDAARKHETVPFFPLYYELTSLRLLGLVRL